MNPNFHYSFLTFYFTRGRVGKVARNKNNAKEEPIEKQLWKIADKLRKNIDAAEYKHIVLGLIFLKYISDAFESLYSNLERGEGEYAGADPEDRDEYKAENVFLCQFLLVGLTCKQEPSCRKSAKMLMRLWILLKRKIPPSGEFCQKCMHEATLTRQVWVD